jgi:hypothetical protein
MISGVDVSVGQDKMTAVRTKYITHNAEHNRFFTERFDGTGVTIAFPGTAIVKSRAITISPE